MGDAQSKPMALGSLSKESVEKIKKKFHLKDGNEKLSTLDFIYGYPCILRPYVALILPSLHEMFKKKEKSLEKQNHFGINCAFNMLFRKGSKKFKNVITLQDIVSILSYVIEGKTKIIINILFTSFLTYSKSTHTEDLNEPDRQNSKAGEEKNRKKYECEKREAIEEKEEEQDSEKNSSGMENASLEKKEQSAHGQRSKKTDGKYIRKMSKKKQRQPTLKHVLSDSNLDEMNKSSRKERSYKFLKDNIYLLIKQKIHPNIGKNISVKELIEVEESLHHLFTYMYIEHLYLLCSSNTLFQLSNHGKGGEKNKLLTRSKTNLCKEFLLKRKNSWDMTFFFPDLYCSLENDLDFRNILSGFRLYINSKENSKLNLYCLAVEYISSTFLNLSITYSNATFKHFTDIENVYSTNEKEEEEEAKIEDALNNEQLDDICLTSFELIHSIYTNIKKNELKNQKNAEDISKKKWKEAYTRSSSILEIQTKTNGWRGLFLNKTSKILTDEIVFALRQCSKSFTNNNEWYRLYASWKQGTSFNQFISSFLHYPSPIVIVIKTHDHQILGGVSTTTLKDSHLFSGSSNDFLFSASPVFRIIRTNGLGNNYVYLNSKNAFYPKGLGFGGKTECFRFFLSDEFKESYCTQSDYTYEGGRFYFPLYKKRDTIYSGGKNTNSMSGERGNHENINGTYSTEKKMEQTENNSFKKNMNNGKGNSGGISSKAKEESEDEEEADDFLCKLHIDEVEVWGCGDTNALEEQRIMLQNEETCKQERRSVDKSKILQNSFDKEFLLPKMFVGKMEEMVPDT